MADETTTGATQGVGNRTRASGALGTARKLLVLVVGMTVLLVGVALVVLPGPAFLVIPAGLAILATEFLWARRLLRYGKQRAAGLFRRGRGVARESRRPRGAAMARRVGREVDGAETRSPPPQGRAGHVCLGRLPSRPRAP